MRRGGGVVYAGGSTFLPVQPSEAEFHIHPCFGPALSALEPAEVIEKTPIDDPVPATVGYVSPHDSGPPSPHVLDGSADFGNVTGGEFIARRPDQ